LSLEKFLVKVFDVHVRLYVVFCPAAKMPIVWSFWIHYGVGISSRLAEDCMKQINLLHEVSDSDSPPTLEEVKAQVVIRERIVDLFERVSNFL
jgi:cystathionine gamma-synthase